MNPKVWTDEQITNAKRTDLRAYLVTLGHRDEDLAGIGLFGPDGLQAMAKRGPVGGYVPPPVTITPAVVSGPATAGQPINPQPTSTNDGLMTMIAAGVAPIIRDTLRAEFNAALDNRPKIVEHVVNVLTAAEPIVIPVGQCHKNLPLVIKWLLRKRNVFVYGEAGGGKTTMARQVADILTKTLQREIPHRAPMSFGPSSQPYEVLGHVDATGKYHTTSFRLAWEFGGIVLLDEFDSAEEIMVCLNAALGNGHCVFPDSPQAIEKHPDCYIIAAGNTTGLGPNERYTARRRIDAATRNRFVFVEWGYDEAFEIVLAGEDQIKWTRHVQSIRAALERLGKDRPDCIATPRASIWGADMLRAEPATTFEELEQALIWPGMDEDTVSKVRMAMGSR